MLWLYVATTATVMLWLRPAVLHAYVVAPTRTTQERAALATGCHHNGTWYADKSLIPTVEKCLNCQCQRKTLVCRLKVCPEMPMPPPRGCVVVQQRSSCCPYLSCARLEAFYKLPITRRIIQYLDHYERESIDRVVNDNMLQRRSDDSGDVDMQICVKNGTVYKSGSAMSSSNLCSYCYCIGGAEKCVKPKCMLPVEGCKPIFVDSTCCPVRYDCSAKASGKSSQEVRYRKNSNKHFQRMSNRLQRNRGCSTSDQFYAEGQKMKSDGDKPCDICFCIRGQRRCAPKKCAPALKNCIPVVPKGQCCPSSYDCGSQRDYRRAQSSRQFNLYSLIFGKEGGETDAAEHSATDNIATQYPHDRKPPNEPAPVDMPTTSEKSIFDTIREGLEFIDGNNDKLLEHNLDLVAAGDRLRPLAILPPTMAMSTEPTTSTEVSLLDLLLRSTDTQDDESAQQPEDKTSPTSTYEKSWVDMLLGDDEEYNQGLGFASTMADKSDAMDSVTPSQQSDFAGSSIDRFDADLQESASAEVVALPQQHVESTTPMSTTTTRTTLKSTRPRQPANKPVFRPIATSTQKLAAAINANAASSIPIATSTSSTTVASPAEPLTAEKEQPGFLSAFLDGFSSVLSAESQQVANQPHPSNITTTSSTTTTTTTTSRPTTSVTTTTGATKAASPTAAPPLPSFKPLPTHKTHTRINSKIANLTTNPPLLTTQLALNATNFKPLPPIRAKLPMNVSTAKPKAKPTASTTTRRTTTAPASTTTSTTTNRPTSRPTAISTPTTTTQATTTTRTTKRLTTVRLPSITSTVEPLLIKTNPTILESEPLDSSAEPTLPPSLPNLKIIPFLPTDAVKKETATAPPPPPPLYGEYYHSGGGAGSTAPHVAAPRIDYDLYDEGNHYPAITERFPTYPAPELNDGSKAEYSYKFNVEGPEAATRPAANTVGQALDGVPPNAGAFVKYDFVGDIAEVELGVPAPATTQQQQATMGFSPPTKTEGGFVPKETFTIGANGELLEADDGSTDNYHVTQHIIDITSAAPLAENATKVIEFTTPDPFRDVLRTEMPPDLTMHRDDKTQHTKGTVSAAVNDTRLQGGRPTSTGPPPFKTLPATGVSDQTAESEAKAKPITMPHTIPTTTIRKSSKTPTTTTTGTPTTTTVAKSTTAKAKITKPRPNAAAATATNYDNNNNNSKSNKQANSNSSGEGNHSAATVKATTRPKLNSKATTPASRTSSTTAAATEPSTATASTNGSKTTTTTTTMTTTTTTVSTTAHPFLQSPFDKLPFMDASFKVRPYPVLLASTTADGLAARAPNAAATMAQQSDPYLNLLPYKNSLNQYEGLEPIYEMLTTPTTTTTTAAPTRAPNYYHHYGAATAVGGNAGGAGNNFIDGAGFLKLAGCNIYGRMYRVGRIILELSSACLECKCTEVGVKCGPLDC